LNARVWAAAATCYNIQASWGWIDRNKFKEGEKAAIKAIKLDDKLADGHRALGEDRMYDFDWSGANAEFQTALNLEPTNPDVLRIVGILSTTLGHLDKAIALYKRSLALDPIRPITYLHLGIDSYYSNRLGEAIIFFKKTLELNPQFPRPHSFLAQVYLLQGKPGTALTEAQQETDDTWKGFTMSLVYHALGRKKEADEELTNYITTFQEGHAWEIAGVYAFRRENDKAFEWLDKAYNSRATMFIWFKNDPLFKSLEGDPRYTALLKKMNLPLD